MGKKIVWSFSSGKLNIKNECENTRMEKMFKDTTTELYIINIIFYYLNLIWLASVSHGTDILGLLSQMSTIHKNTSEPCLKKENTVQL